MHGLMFSVIPFYPIFSIFLSSQHDVHPSVHWHDSAATMLFCYLVSCSYVRLGSVSCANCLPCQQERTAEQQHESAETQEWGAVNHERMWKLGKAGRLAHTITTACASDFKPAGSFSSIMRRCCDTSSLSSSWMSTQPHMRTAVYLNIHKSESEFHTSPQRITHWEVAVQWVADCAYTQWYWSCATPERFRCQC